MAIDSQMHEHAPNVIHSLSLQQASSAEVGSIGDDFVDQLAIKAGSYFENSPPRGIDPIRHELKSGIATNLAEGLWCIRLEVSAGPGHINTYVIEDTDGLTLIDTGTNSNATIDQLTSGLNSIGKSFADIHSVIVTHFHPDHAGLAGHFAADGVKVYASAETAELVQHGIDTCTPFPNADEVAMAQRAGAAGMELEAYRRRSKQQYSPNVAAITADDFSVLTNADELTIGGRVWRVVVIGGHAPGQITLWSDDKIAIVGDHLLLGMSPSLMVPPELPDYDPIAEYLDACERFLEIADDSWQCLPGHHEPFYGIQSRCDQMASSLKGALQRFLSVFPRPRTIVDAIEVLYGKPVAKVDRLNKMSEATGYMNHLRRTNEIKVTVRGSQYILRRSLRSN